MTECTKKELDAIRFYMGDPEIVNRGDFRGGTKAYNTINALLHSGIQNELDKIREGKTVEIFDVEHLKSYISLICDILSAMDKYCRIVDNTRLCTYRIERFSAIEPMREKGYVEGFYSTCKWGYLKEYASTKAEIILMEIEREKDVPYLDFEHLFGENYAKPEEAEILLPPHAVVKTIDEVEMTQEEKREYIDVNGNPPVKKYRIAIAKNIKEQGTGIQTEEIYNEITSDVTVSRVKKCLEDLRLRETLSEAEIKFYCEWKEKLQTYVKCSNII